MGVPLDARPFSVSALLSGRDLGHQQGFLGNPRLRHCAAAAGIEDAVIPRCMASPFTPARSAGLGEAADGEEFSAPLRATFARTPREGECRRRAPCTMSVRRSRTRIGTPSARSISCAVKCRTSLSDAELVLSVVLPPVSVGSAAPFLGYQRCRTTVGRFERRPRVLRRRRNRRTACRGRSGSPKRSVSEAGRELQAVGDPVLG
jgi:hypothetical protein